MHFQENGTPVGMGMMGYDSDTVLPSVVVTDAEGVVRFADLPDNRLRPEPQAYLNILDELRDGTIGADMMKQTSNTP